MDTQNVSNTKVKPRTLVTGQMRSLGAIIPHVGKKHKVKVKIGVNLLKIACFLL